MQILSISSAASTATVLNPVAVSRSTAASSPASSTSANASSGTAAASTASSATTSSAKSSRSGGGGGGGGSSAAQEVQQATSFSTTVQGKQYSGSVQESNGQYTASVPGLAGASASGSSITAAENALYIRIDELV